jgi:hypothetical protein
VLIKTVLFTFIQELGSQMPSKFAGGNLASEIKLEHYFFFKLAILGFFLFCRLKMMSILSLRDIIVFFVAVRGVEGAYNILLTL